MSLAERLKSETSDIHKDVERTFGIMSPDLSLDGYRNILLALLEFIEPRELHLQDYRQWSQFGLSPEARYKSHLIRADLENLSHSLPEKNLTQFSFTSFEEAIGYLYVIEGSTLGGQIISRHLRDHLSVDSNSGAAYFSGYASETGKKWLEFKSFLNEVERSPIDADKVVNGARQAFTDLYMRLKTH